MAKVLDAIERLGDRLESLQPLDVPLDRLTPCSGAGAGDGVGGSDEDADHRSGDRVIVVRRQRIPHLIRFPVLGDEINAEADVRSLVLPVDGLADVVQQPRPARH